MTVIVSEQYQFVIGVDTHAATHTVALIAATTGTVIDHAMFPTTTAGLSRVRGGEQHGGGHDSVDADQFEQSGGLIGGGQFGETAQFAARPTSRVRTRRAS